MSGEETMTEVSMDTVNVPSKVPETKAQEMCNDGEVTGAGEATANDDADDVQPEKKARLDVYKSEHGMARIKPEFIDYNHKRKLVLDYLPKDAADELTGAVRDNDKDEAPGKKKKFKGRNKNSKRPVEKRTPASERLCPNVKGSQECRFGEKCIYIHDVKKYMEIRPKDLGDKCHVFETFGYCPQGVTCMFAGKHITEEFKNIVNEELYKKFKGRQSTFNSLDKDVQIKLWKKKYDFTKANDVIKKTTSKGKAHGTNQNKNGTAEPKTKQENITESESSLKHQETTVSEMRDNEVGKLEETTSEKIVVTGETLVCDRSDGTAVCDEALPSAVTPGGLAQLTIARSGPLTDEDVIPLRPQEKKKIDFVDKLYLAPLTTVGNLPFRRICKTYGADITCGEMAMCTNLLQGQASEWALLKRHESEDIFGVQLCGSYPDTMTRCVQMLSENCQLDFVDINCGCPIDLIFKRGEGSALMARHNRLGEVVRSLTHVTDMPITVKIRTGIYEEKNIAHTLVPRLRDWGASLVTLHGRSREQRYNRLADWGYISECAKVATPMPIFGNGDILSYLDAKRAREETGVSGVMIARGALIKPWVFQEIKEERHWDISANERFDMLKDYANFGMEHWGSDQQGIATTRRFLLEWLSFLHRYIPVGLLEQVPQKINEKPPYYIGRSDLETLLSSANSADWVKISEMLLGPVPSGFTFLPKHRANAYK